LVVTASFRIERARVGGGGVFCGKRCRAGAEAGFEGLGVELQAFDALDEALDGAGHGGEELAGAGVAEGLGLHVGEEHGAAAGEEPVGVEQEALGERG